MSVSTHQRDVAAAVEGFAAGSISVTSVRVDLEQDADVAYTRVVVVLTAPTGPTWDPDDFYDVRRRVRAAVVDVLGPDTELQLVFESEDRSGAGETDSDSASEAGKEPSQW